MDTGASMARRQGRRMAAALCGATLISAAPQAEAGGFEIPESGTVALGRGGAFVARGDDPTAILLNPGALLRLSGTRLLLNHALTWEHATFTRQASDIPPGTDYGFDPLAPVSNAATLFPLGAMLVASTDFGLEDWTFAAGVFGPNAHGERDYPVDGGQRYLLTQLESVMFTPSLAVAWGDRERFGLGLTLQWVVAPSLDMSLVVDGSQAGELHAYYSGNDVEARISLSDLTAFSAIAGAWWRPIPELEIGVSGRILPASLGLEGDFSLRNIPGQTQFSPQQLEVPGAAARLELTLPPTARAGVRYRHLEGADEVFDLELDLVYEAWSFIDRYNVELDGTINLFVGAEAPDTLIEKRWQDTLSVRLGSTWNAWKGEQAALRISGGAYWESAAVPANYEHLDFLSFERIGLGLGVGLELGQFRIDASYGHVFQEDRVVDEKRAKVFQQRPLDPCPESCDGGAGWSGVPSNAGRFETGYDILSLGVNARF
jgi:long-chain fatty acid transport protein